MADLSLLQQAAGIMQKCGAFSYVQQGAVLPLLKSFIMPMVLQPNTSITFTKEITGDTIWNLALHLFRSGVQFRHGRAIADSASLRAVSIRRQRYRRRTVRMDWLLAIPHVSRSGLRAGLKDSMHAL